MKSIQTLKGPLEKTVDEKKGEIVKVQKKITVELSGEVRD